MTRTASKRQPVRPAASATSARGSAYLSPSAWRRTWTVVGWAVTVSAAAWGMNELDAYVRASRAGVECNLEWASLPTWLRDPNYAPVLTQIAEHASLARDDDIQAPDL